MKQITNISRILVGALFIISGLIKLNDPVGFSFKLKDYFAPDVLDIEIFTPFALVIALFVNFLAYPINNITPIITSKNLQFGALY